MKIINKFLSYVGGKRGLAVILGALGTIAVQLHWITPEIATKIADLAAMLGIVGIAHHNMKG